jgi:hypothetical protein
MITQVRLSRSMVVLRCTQGLLLRIKHVGEEPLDIIARGLADVPVMPMKRHAPDEKDCPRGGVGSPRARDLNTTILKLGLEL